MEFRLVLKPGAIFESIGWRWDNGDPNDGELGENNNCTCSILTNICRTLAETTSSKFFVTGFNLNWPVSVNWDLCIFLEHLPESLEALKNESDFEIYFYEQGIERRIEFKHLGQGKYSATCFQRRCDIRDEKNAHSILPCYYAPYPTIEEVERDQLIYMLASIRDELLAYLQIHEPKIANHPWIVDYFNGIGTAWSPRELDNLSPRHLNGE